MSQSSAILQASEDLACFYDKRHSNLFSQSMNEKEKKVYNENVRCPSYLKKISVLFIPNKFILILEYLFEMSNPNGVFMVGSRPYSQYQTSLSIFASLD